MLGLIHLRAKSEGWRSAITQSWTKITLDLSTGIETPDGKSRERLNNKSTENKAKSGFLRETMEDALEDPWPVQKENWRRSSYPEAIHLKSVYRDFRGTGWEGWFFPLRTALHARSHLG